MSTLLDTNVLSELLRSEPEPMVLAWFAAQPSETLFVSAVTQAEMLSHCGNHRRQDERRKAPGRAGGPRDHRQQHAGQPCVKTVRPLILSLASSMSRW